jgi:ABC-type nitrate/sulfonate/bicarbonate transport system substrate-binding protein
MRWKRLVGAALCAILAQLPAARGADTVQMGLLGAANAVDWPYYIGLHKNIFADAGVKLDVIYSPTPAGLVQQLASGSLDICDIGAVEPIHAVARGAPVAMLRITEAVSPYEVLAKPEIKTLKDLKGHTVVIGGLVDINRVYLERLLKAAGLTDKDIDITTIGNTAGRFAALKSGSADATMLAPPVNFFAQAAGFPAIATIMDYTKDLPFGATNVSRAYAEKHPDTVKHFMDALDKSIAWFNDDTHRSEAVEILAQEMKTDNREDIGKSFDFLRKIGFFPNDRTVSKKHLEALMTEMAAIGDTDGKVPLDKLLLAGVTKIGD